MKYFLISILAILLGGCAASPDTMIYVEKNIYVLTEGEVNITYTSNADVKSAAELRGEVSPPITVTPAKP